MTIGIAKRVNICGMTVHRVTKHLVDYLFDVERLSEENAYQVCHGNKENFLHHSWVSNEFRKLLGVICANEGMLSFTAT